MLNSQFSILIRRSAIIAENKEFSRSLGWELGIGKLLRCRLMASLPRMVQGRFHVTLYLQTDHSHQLQSVTLLYDAGEHAVAEEHFALFQVIFEMDVCRAWRQCIRDRG